MENSSFFHQPVLVNDVLNHLIGDKQGVYIDCTLGEGGHTKAILSRLGCEAKLIGFDQDKEIQEIAKERLKGFKQFIPINDNFIHMLSHLKELGVTSVDGIFADLGISMFHYKKSLKGFSFYSEEPLDMTLNGSHPNVFDVVNKMSLNEIAQILKKYGQEKNYYRIASFIIYYREHIKNIESTKELTMIIERALGSLSFTQNKKRSKKIHKATKSFQAFRIFVNNELENLEILLKEGFSCLKIGGRFAILTYHSLEDGIVKSFFEKNQNYIRIVTKKPIIASQEEVAINSASRSAKLRVYEKRYDDQTVS
jgi:16S rRNA (cytosine1402-N4)-methyltransferase